MKKIILFCLLLIVTDSQAQGRGFFSFLRLAPSTWWYKETITDADIDGDIGSQVIDSLKQKKQPIGYVATRPILITVFDCNDANVIINHSGVEIWNQLDDNCNGDIDEGVPNPNLITLTITSTNNSIYPIHGVLYSNSEKLGQLSKTPALLNAVHNLKISYSGNEGGSDMKWHHRWNQNHEDGVGLNCYEDEILYSQAVRCAGTTSVLNGRCCDATSGVNFPTWFEYLTLLDTTNSVCMFSPNIWGAAYSNDVKRLGYAPIFDEWAQQKIELGNTVVKYVVLGTEDQIYKDLFPTATNYVTTCNNVLGWLKTNFNPEFIVADINGNPKWDDIVTAGIPEANAYRYYLQFQSTLTDYDMIRNEINVAFEGQITGHLLKYPNKKMFFLQSEFKAENRYNGTVAHALATVEKNIVAIKLNQVYSNVIIGFTEQNLKKLFNNDLSLPPQYYGFNIVGNADNSTYCTSTLLNCVTLAYVTTDGSIEAIVINPNATAITIEQIVYNGFVRSVDTIEGYYGNALADKVLITENSLTMQPYSFKLIKLR